MDQRVQYKEAFDWSRQFRGMLELAKTQERLKPLHKRESDTAMLVRVMKDPQITPELVQGWLSGTDIPRRPQDHDRLMQLVGLDVVLPTQKQFAPPLTPIQQRKATYRAEIERLYRRAKDALPSQPPALEEAEASGPPPTRPTGDDPVYDKPPLDQPPYQRVHDPRNGRYDDPSNLELLPEIMSLTQNAHEFIYAYRLTKFPSRADACHVNVLNVDVATLRHWETGIALPGPEQFSKLERLFKHDPGKLIKAERLIITNRLAMADHAVAAGDATGAMDQLEQMPKEYWIEAIAQLREKQGLPVSGTRPEWSDLVRPIETQGEYLRAMRYAHGIKPKDMATDLAISTTTLAHSECQYNLPVAAARVAMADYLAQQEKPDAAFPLFDGKLLKALPGIGKIKPFIHAPPERESARA